jgi:hypothetical protein
MRDLRILETRREYEEYVRDAVFAEPRITGHPFYSRLIRFVLDAKAPVFYRQSDPSEHASFSVYYDFVLLRETYTNPTLRALYFLHDFAHAVFHYPHDVTTVTQAEFDEAVIQGEYAASNETEVLAHWRIAGLRERVLQDRRILWDVLTERGVAQPPPRALFVLRRALVEGDDLDPFFFTRAADEPVRAQLKAYRGNGAWCKRRFTRIRALPAPGEFFHPFLTVNSYERAIAAYESACGQVEYERTTLRNVRLAWALIGLPEPPRSFGECRERIGELEGRILLPPDEPGAA